MCGLFGFSTTQNIKNLAGAALVLAFENQCRGRDSWGFTNGQNFVKSVGPVERQWHMMPLRNRGLMMAHTRAATVGAIKAENSHPFEYKDKFHVIGAHNGYIHNWEDLNKKHGRGFEVDSMHIFAHIASGLPLDELEGGGAVTFLKDRSLYFSRFNGGTLAIAQLMDAEKQPIGLAWSSLEVDLKKALEGADIKYQTYDVETEHIYFWKDNKLFDSKDKMPIQSYAKRATTAYTDQEDWHNKEWDYKTQSWRLRHGSKSEKRFVRLRVVRQLPAATQLPQPTQSEQELEDIKRKIFKDENVVSFSEDAGKCTECQDDTRLKLLDDRFMCLTCIAKKIQSGEIVITTEQPQA